MKFITFKSNRLASMRLFSLLSIFVADLAMAVSTFRIKDSITHNGREYREGETDSITVTIERLGSVSEFGVVCIGDLEN